MTDFVLVNAMVPAPGESPGEWWGNLGHVMPADVLDAFFHDVPADVVAAAMEQGEPPQSGTPFEKPWPLAAWPGVPTLFLQGRDDRFFPPEFQRRVVADRLGDVTFEEIPGGHLNALSRPVELVDHLLGPAPTSGRTPS
ncbi:alpha/beta fold hydrolase [Pseudonocardia sp. GCM10023141]|uniref:alpha/beta fold hydrolase n=1 Tax=Pseudonocardia sp. GCM10023141 TaxID=3252653 RepID=UPI00361CCB2A